MEESAPKTRSALSGIRPMHDKSASCDGEYAKKPTVLVSSRPALLQPFSRLRCDGSHTHGDTEGRRSRPLQTHTWEMASRIVDGIWLLKKALEHSPAAFPVAEASQPERVPPANEGEPADDPEAWRRCPGCAGRMRKTDPAHNRVVGQCKHPHVTPDNYKCIASKGNLEIT